MLTKEKKCVIQCRNFHILWSEPVRQRHCGDRWEELDSSVRLKIINQFPGPPPSAFPLKSLCSVTNWTLNPDLVSPCFLVPGLWAQWTQDAWKSFRDAEHTVAIGLWLLASFVIPKSRLCCKTLIVSQQQATITMGLKWHEIWTFKSGQILFFQGTFVYQVRHICRVYCADFEAKCMHFFLGFTEWGLHCISAERLGLHLMFHGAWWNTSFSVGLCCLLFVCQVLPPSHSWTSLVSWRLFMWVLLLSHTHTVIANGNLGLLGFNAETGFVVECSRVALRHMVLFSPQQKLPHSQAHKHIRREWCDWLLQKRLYQISHKSFNTFISPEEMLILSLTHLCLQNLMINI